MEEKTLTILEFDKIIERLAAHASSEPGRAYCMRLRPSSALRHIEEWQQNTADACDRIRLHGSGLSFRGAKDLGEIQKRLAVGASLAAYELLAVDGALSVAERAKQYGSGKGRSNSGDGAGTGSRSRSGNSTESAGRKGRPDSGSGSEEQEERGDSLSEMFDMLEPLSSIRREISRCIVSEEEIADDASPALASVRRKMKQAQNDIHDAMASRLNSYRDYLTDAIITQRDGRYCLPVKAEYKSKVPGMVHDASSTGLTLFIEPMAVVSLNNKLRELAVEEKKEIDQVLLNLSQQLMPYIDVLSDNAKILEKLDMIFAKALFAGELNAVRPVFSKDRSIDLKEARHPLIEKDQVVPIDVRLGHDFDQLIITGPNTGGKTVSLKTTGLLTLMGQAGLHIPAAEGSVLGVFEDVYADIGDEQSIEQSLSTFSAHMKNIVHILKKADPDSLCLFDELGSGTDPTEGAALGIAILGFLHNMQTRTMATTHYSEIKLYALETAGVENACCEFDVQTLRPTYRLLIGIPGKSNAFAISRRLGLPQYIIDDAKRHIAAENENFEDIIRQLNEDRARMEKSKAEAEAAKQEITTLRGRIRKKEEKLEESREKILAEAREEAQKILRDAKETADLAIREIQRNAAGGRGDGNGSGAGSSNSDMEAARDLLRAEMRKNDTGPAVAVKGPSKPVSARKLQVGDEVRVMGMGGVSGTVTSLPDRDGNIFVQIGFMKSKVNVREIEMADGGTSGGSSGGKGGSSGKPSGSGSSKGGGFGSGFGSGSSKGGSSGGVKKSFGAKALTISPEVNLIGMTTDEALPVLEKYLDDAYLAHLSSARIVHGRGTGALKNMVHQRLRKMKNVDSFRLGQFGEGGDGVTIVTFK